MQKHQQPKQPAKKRRPLYWRTEQPTIDRIDIWRRQQATILTRTKATEELINIALDAEAIPAA
ncbi:MULTISPECIES: hypothetical protein [unclassified Bradyrhizobium]|uniref:hypothetical protein n=1 Tax=unclassified Bradyrhizobium TaxID=2631580 RepID=UPI0028E56D35|nr:MULTISPECIES: hypothetical protein [unclassified Bradyrhizobium]